MILGNPKGAYFLVVDGDLPEHIQKTFRMTPEGNFIGAAQPLFVTGVIRDGDTIPDNLTFAVVIYHNNLYMQQRAVELINQIRDLSNQYCVIVSIPIDADIVEPVKDVDYRTMHYAFQGLVP